MTITRVVDGKVHAFELTADEIESIKTMERKRYVVRMTRIYSADIVVEAYNEKEAEKIAYQLEKDADYYPIMGSLELDDVYEES